MARSFSTQDRIRFGLYREMGLLLELNGFVMRATYGDYEYQPYRYEAQMMVFVCRPRS